MHIQEKIWVVYAYSCRGLNREFSTDSGQKLSLGFSKVKSWGSGKVKIIISHVPVGLIVEAALRAHSVMSDSCYHGL